MKIAVILSVTDTVMFYCLSDDKLIIVLINIKKVKKAKFK